jgi:hypothetical protein
MELSSYFLELRVTSCGLVPNILQRNMSPGKNFYSTTLKSIKIK